MAAPTNRKTFLTGVCRKKKRKTKAFGTFRPPKEKDLSAECLLRAPPSGESFSISVNPYTRRSDVRELLVKLQFETFASKPPLKASAQSFPAHRFCECKGLLRQRSSPLLVEREAKDSAPRSFSLDAGKVRIFFFLLNLRQIPFTSNPSVWWFRKVRTLPIKVLGVC